MCPLCCWTKPATPLTNGAINQTLRFFAAVHVVLSNAFALRVQLAMAWASGRQY